MMSGEHQDNVIVVRELTKRYGDLVAVDHVSFEVRRGEVFGMLGPNGAGKTTTEETLEGMRAVAVEGAGIADVTTPLMGLAA